MDKLPMCRICLVQNVNMYVVVNKNLHELYEKLTDIPFVTKDSRPILACFFCYAKLKQCFRLLRKCLEAEELFSQMMNDVYEPKPSISQDDLHCCTGFIKSPIVHISIVDGCETDSIAIKEELPDICERQDYVIEPKKEYQSDDLDLENQNNTCLGTEDIPPHLSVSDSGRNVKIEVEEELELSKKKRRAVGTSITMTNRPSYAQLEALVGFLEQNTGIAKGLLRTAQAQLETKRKWANLATTLNSIGGVNKDGRGWAKYWAEKKCALKKTCAGLSASMRRTGGGTEDNMPALSALENRMVAVMGGQEFATGDSRLTVNPFPQPTRPTEPEPEVVLSKVNTAPVQEQDTEMTETGYFRIVSPIPGTSRDDAIPASSTIVSDEYETDSIAIKEEVPAICERQDYVIEPKEEYQSDDLDLENLNNSCLSIEDIRHLSESDSGDDVKIEVDEEQELSKKKRRAVETNRAPFTKKPKLDSQRTRLEDTMTMVELKKTEHSNLEAIRTTKNVTSKQGSSVKESSKCDQRRRKADIKKHFRTHTGDKPYKCEVCQRSFIHKINLTAHEKTHTGVKPYQCDVCQRSYSTKINLTKHIRIHTGENPYKCEVCQRSFSQKSNLTAHVRIHTGEKPYQCDVCQRSYTKKTNLTKHIRIHTGENPYQCDICQRSFSIEGHLTAHNRIHTGENPHQCDICQRSFSVRSSLTKHIRIHTGEKPHQCNVCQRSFSEKSSLTKHFRIHTGEKPHKCEVCQRSFSERGSLTKHMRIHTGHKPFKCECRFCKL